MKKQFELDVNLWFVKLYFWCLDICDEFMCRHTPRDGGGRCLAIRTCCIWTPVAFLCNLAIICGAPYVLLYYTIDRFGLEGYGTGLFFTAGLIGAVSLVSRLTS
ncbi:hypothetical protein KC872_03080, partial [Candidatus Kaiserbacteria bacterium]|nr:hypothetical protein [Candidatus Kaiserbacteria bacterium]